MPRRAHDVTATPRPKTLSRPSTNPSHPCAELALALAGQAAIAIENARLYEQAQELASLEERRHLARELHDSVSQTMFSIVLNIRSAQILLERDPTRIRPQMEQLQELTQNVLTDMRSVISKLRPKSG